MTIEELLKKSGDFGPAQLWLLSLFCIVNLLSSFHYFSQTFISLEGDPCIDGGLNASVGYGPGHDPRFRTLAFEMGWECEEGWKMALVQSMFFIGSVLGTLLLGFLADVLGRLPMLFVSNVFAVLGNIMTVYLPPALWSLGLSRFVAGLATDTNFFMMYIIVMEYIRPEFRTFGLNLCIGIWYCVGCMATPWLAIYTGNWRTFLIVISIPMLVVPMASLFMPESAQWLMSKGRIDDAIRNFKKIANFNGKDLSPEFVARFKEAPLLKLLAERVGSLISQMEFSYVDELPATQYNTFINYGNHLIARFRFNTDSTGTYSKSENGSGNLWGLFKTPHLRKKTLILIFKTMVLTLCYDAISRNINGLEIDPFLLFTITSSSIFPSCLVILIFQDRIGRKAVAVFSIFLTGIFSFAQGTILALETGSFYLKITIGLLGRFAINIAYNSGTQYAAELIPTQVRGQGLAAIHVVGYGAAFFSPHILYLSSRWIALPEIILGSLSIAGAAFCILLPETLNKSLPATLEDGELFGQDENIWDFLKMKKNVKQIEITGKAC